MPFYCYSAKIKFKPLAKELFISVKGVHYTVSRWKFLVFASNHPKQSTAYCLDLLKKGRALPLNENSVYFKMGEMHNPFKEHLTAQIFANNIN